MWQKTLSYWPFLSLKACNSCSVNCEPSWKISFNYPLFPRLRLETFGFCFYSFSCLLFTLDFNLHVNHAFRLETSWCLLSSPVWHRDDAVPILSIYFFFIYLYLLEANYFTILWNIVTHPLPLQKTSQCLPQMIVNAEHFLPLYAEEFPRKTHACYDQ